MLACLFGCRIGCEVDWLLVCLVVCLQASLFDGLSVCTMFGWLLNSVVWLCVWSGEVVD